MLQHATARQVVRMSRSVEGNPQANGAQVDPHPLEGCLPFLNVTPSVPGGRTQEADSPRGGRDHRFHQQKLRQNAHVFEQCARFSISGTGAGADGRWLTTSTRAGLGRTGPHAPPSQPGDARNARPRATRTPATPSPSPSGLSCTRGATPIPPLRVIQQRVQRCHRVLGGAWGRDSGPRQGPRGVALADRHHPT